LGLEAFPCRPVSPGPCARSTRTRFGALRLAAMGGSESTEGRRGFMEDEIKPLAAQREEHLTRDEKGAHHKPHQCTDVCSLLVLVFGIAMLGRVGVYASKHGDMRRLSHGLDFYGNLCGVSKSVENKRYLYWCPKPKELLPDAELLNMPGAILNGAWKGSETLDLQHPICTNQCPRGSQTTSACFQGKHVVRGKPDPATGTFKENATYKFDLIQDYETYALAGRYCLPTDTRMLAELLDTLETGEQGYMFAAQQVMGAWAALLMTAVIAIVLGYVYLFLVENFARIIIFGSLAISAALCIVFSVVWLYGVFAEDIDDIFESNYNLAPAGLGTHIPSTGHKSADFAIGLLVLLLGAFIILMACCLKRSLQLAIASIEAACDCLTDMPSLLICPIVGVAIKLLLVGAEFAGLLWLISVGKVERYDMRSEYIPGGITRSFSYEDNEYIYIIFYVFMCIWLLELVYALEQFVLSYSTQLWYFKEYDGNGKKPLVMFPLWRGLFIGVVYHLGTMALGSFLLSLLETLRMALTILYKYVLEAEEDGKSAQNKVVGALISCCCCCLTCFERYIRFMNKNAYIVVAVNSDPFCVAAQRAFNIVAGDALAMAWLTGASWVFQIGGVVSITGCGVFLTWFLVGNAQAFTDRNSEHYVASPEAVAVAGAVICFTISCTFMAVFDTLADTILFCWALDRQYHKDHWGPRKNFCPPRLLELLDRVERESGKEANARLISTGNTGY